MTIQWYKDGDELSPALNVKIETSDTESKLRLLKCQRKDCGEVKIKIKNKYGIIEAISKLIVLGKLPIRDIMPCVPHCTVGKEIKVSMIYFIFINRQTHTTTRTCGHYGKRCYIC